MRNRTTRSQVVIFSSGCILVDTQFSYIGYHHTIYFVAHITLMYLESIQELCAIKLRNKMRTKRCNAIPRRYHVTNINKE
jgi:hypothetical protein